MHQDGEPAERGECPLQTREGPAGADSPVRGCNASLACAVSKLRFRAFPGSGDRSPWRREVQGVGKREVPGDCDSYAEGNSFPDSVPAQRSLKDRHSGRSLQVGGRCEQRAGDVQEASFG